MQGKQVNFRFFELSPKVARYDHITSVATKNLKPEESYLDEEHILGMFTVFDNQRNQISMIEKYKHQED